jgi:uncharacterized protein YqeY
MSIKIQLTENMKQAMRDKDRLKLDVIRFLLAEIKNNEIDRGELSDEQIFQLISKQIKQIKEVVADYQKVGNTEVAENEQKKVAILEAYLPAQMSEAEILAIIAQAKIDLPDANMGQLIGAVKQKVGALADGGTIAELIKKQSA